MGRSEREVVEGYLNRGISGVQRSQQATGYDDSPEPKQGTGADN